MRPAILLAASLAFAVEPQSAEETAKDTAALQGKWEVTYAEFEGQPDTDLYRRPGRRTTIIIEKNKLTITDGFTDPKVTRFKLDSSTTPRSIDLLDGKGKDMIIKGVYSLDTDSFKLCQNLNDERPKDFKTKSGDGNSLLVLKRLKQ